ncbi:M18 family aminopeptidase [Anaerolentibacter hominis]|uniref:M18 family aminopeptidase n=1 Tax=Anaerolentibacter hominis TaxID=3079009 RepID=UPI0031B7EC77
MLERKAEQDIYIELKQRLAESTSSYHTVRRAALDLKEAGFTYLNPEDKWELKPGGKYYTVFFGSALFAFTAGRQFITAGSLRAAIAHTDFPGFKLKPGCGIKQSGYGKLNTSVYGGPILNTWLDRPLSISGKVALKGSLFEPRMRLVDFKRPVLTIPNLAIHMNREVNKGIELNRQKDLLPVGELFPEEGCDDSFFLEALAAELGAAKEDILDYELTVYVREEAERLGFTGKLLSGPRLDNITSVQACVEGITGDIRPSGLNLIGLFDHEEVGSRTRQGADSALLPGLLERIYGCLGLEKERLYRDIASGFLLSVDVAHAHHPNSPEKGDPTNPVLPGKGVAFKMSASQSYACDSELAGILMQLCEANQIPFQKYVNRSDIPGGSTIGSIVSSLIPVRTLDIGVPVLAMHSARECMAVSDQAALESLLSVYFTAE